jgi:hypothetical protein
MTALTWIGLGLLVFVSAGAYDWANSNYIKQNADDSYTASGWSAIVAAFGLVGILGMLEVSPWLSIPEIAGFSTGTFVAVWLRRRKKYAK